MLRAADYRERARASLSGNWGMAVLVCFVGALLGGIQSVIPVTANYQYGEGMSVQIFGINMSLNQLPAEMLGILAVMMSILSIYALAQFVIGGVVELGMCAYFSKRALGENADIKDEFAYFQYFGKALGLRIVTYFLMDDVIYHTGTHRYLSLCDGTIHHGRTSGNGDHGGD